VRPPLRTTAWMACTWPSACTTTACSTPPPQTQVRGWF
jgi:hypothetical protein